MNCKNPLQLFIRTFVWWRILPCLKNVLTAGNFRDYGTFSQGRVVLDGWDMDDVDFKNNGIKVHRKGGADVIVYFGDEVRDALLSYWRREA